MSRNIAVRIDDSLFDEIKKLHVNISDTVRQALTDEVTHKKNELIQDDLLALEKLLSKENPEVYVKLVRQSRDER
ncbi:MAG: type II toxin-antitoxin system CcdA family antitoxin [Candidatus Thermoplasmatota archaeon]|nr:type II toxin-antitoxin system CcdA family antitoxin [Candidatus Thermoplasmatota archaeon]